jgi:hypothetical protein
MRDGGIILNAYYEKADNLGTARAWRGLRLAHSPIANGLDVDCQDFAARRPRMAREGACAPSCRVWTTFAPPCIVPFADAEILYQDLWLQMNERDSEQGRAFAVTRGYERVGHRFGSRHRAPEHMQRTRHG